MNARSRRKIEMGERALEFSRAHPDASAGYANLVTRLENGLQRAVELATRQREGLARSRGATTVKRTLQTEMRQTHLGHLARVGVAAAVDRPELAETLRLARDVRTYRGFRTAAHAMAAEAQANRELLVKHGLAESVLDDLVTVLERFEQAMEHGVEGRREHVGASAELEGVADEIVQVVKLMDGLNRFRFARDQERLAAWQSASTVFATPRVAAPDDERDSGTPDSGTAAGDVRPAA